MFKKSVGLAIVASFVSPLAAFSASPTPHKTPVKKIHMPPPLKAHAVLKDAQGKAMGSADFTQTKGGVLVSLTVNGLEPGPKGFHIHEAGKCEGPEFKSAGGHFNPEGKEHGLHNPKGHHAGDMPNLMVSQTRKAHIDYIDKSITLTPGKNSILKPGGTSLVIHAKKDDERSNPAGDSGARIVCGVIEQIKP